MAAAAAWAAALLVWCTGPAAAEPAPALTAVESQEAGETYLLACRGVETHVLSQNLGGTLFTVELPGAVNEVDPADLPRPAGRVRAISSGSGPEGARLTFTLHRQAAAMIQQVDGGLLLRFLPAAGDDAEPLTAMRPLGTEDLLEVSVFEVPELNRSVRISESGTVALPLIGEIHAAGLTPRELEERIRGILDGGYVKDPHVSVYVQEHGSKKVSVLGAVGKPGVYEMLGPRNLLQVLAQAGGLDPESGAEIFVIRASPGGGHRRIPVSVDALMSSRDPSSNVAIEPGDVISVPRDRMIHIFVDGAVKTPGRIEQPASRRISLLQAIAKAGGATDRANLKKVQILRQGPSGTQNAVLVNLRRVRKGREPDPILRDGDVVVVPETFF